MDIVTGGGSLRGIKLEYLVILTPTYINDSEVCDFTEYVAAF